ncbi:unnamed protein product [Moneuplotes crassus]|uniref:mRNA cap guanine-N(7) methyltransferase n=1 Tax=Euplotes crassus TaxID=5936 RepID=A0AAD1XEP3_EUPCR|nr:unnamed protein product [Moneuplotes crassus]
MKNSLPHHTSSPNLQTTTSTLPIKACISPTEEERTKADHDEAPDETNLEDLQAQAPLRINYIRKREWKAAQKFQMEAMVQMHSHFYENQREQFHALRETSNILFVRKFNNWCKSVLINETCKTKGRFLSALDICCGKGGDLQKWAKNRVTHYVGVDLSDNSVRNACERFKRMKIKGRFPFHGIFMVNDVGNKSNSFLKHLDKRVRFDIASCQMSMHYLCESESTARTFLNNVSSRLVPGGLFCGTTLDADVLIRRLRKQGLNKKNETEKYTFGNQFYSAKFMHRDFPRKRAFGIKYLFYLEDGVGHKRIDNSIEYVPEYLVIFKKFIELAKEYDLELVKRENFHDFYENYIKNKKHKDLFDRIVKPHQFSSTMTKEILEAQWEICNLYQAFTFRKIEGKKSKNKVKGTQGKCGREREDRFVFIDTNK